jgi:hypothetical protein
MYPLGIDCRPDDGSLVAVLTSENLLLNAYRLQFWGNPIFFAADASYRLTQEGNGVFPVITTNLAQQTKTIAYGVISHEHHKAQSFIVFVSINKSALEELVRHRKTNDIPI